IARWSPASTDPSSLPLRRRPLGDAAQNVAGLAVQHAADRIERGEAHRLGAPVLEHGDIGRRDADGISELLHAHLAAGEHHVDVDHDRHQTTSERSCSSCSALRSRPRMTPTSSASDTLTVVPSRARIRMPGLAARATKRMTYEATITTAAASMVPMMMSTYRNACGLKMR